MATKKSKKIRVDLTQEQAEMLGIVGCECGHPRSNHFTFNEKCPCAHCPCDGYKQVLRLPNPKKNG